MMVVYICASDAAGVLGCSIDELDRWRRTILPGDPRREAGQRDDEFRPDEIVAVAAGLWLKSVKAAAPEAVAARLARAMPDGEDWGLVRRGPSKIETFTGTVAIDMHGKARVPKTFNAGRVFDAIRAIGPG